MSLEFESALDSNLDGRVDDLVDVADDSINTRLGESDQGRDLDPNPSSRELGNLILSGGVGGLLLPH